MRALVSFLVLALLGSSSTGCNRHQYEQHTELPTESELRLTPDRNVMHLQAVLERHWPERPTDRRGRWAVSDQLYAYVSLRWVNLGPDPAPTVVELRGSGPGPLGETLVIVKPNEDGSTSLSTTFDFDRCGSPCVFDLELAWHHAPAGELQVKWSVTASRNGYRDRPSGSYDLAYRVIPVETLGRTNTPVVAVPPAAPPPAVVD